MWRSLPLVMLIVAGCSTDQTPSPGTSPDPPSSAATSATVFAETAPEPPVGTAMGDTATGDDAPPSTDTDNRELPSGFDLVGARLTAADGQVCDLCLWLAETSDQRRRGLMFVTDLGPADGMAFLYQSPRTTRFNMENTVLPLSIVFYRSDGAFMDSFDMQPCLTDDCDRYPTPVDFTIAVETLQGQLPALGMIAGSSLELLDAGCVPDSG